MIKNGQTEAQIHRLKLLKRQAYGRAEVALLRQRVLVQGSTAAEYEWRVQQAVRAPINQSA